MGYKNEEQKATRSKCMCSQLLVPTCSYTNPTMITVNQLLSTETFLGELRLLTRSDMSGDTIAAAHVLGQVEAGTAAALDVCHYFYSVIQAEHCIRIRQSSPVQQDEHFS